VTSSPVTSATSAFARLHAQTPTAAPDLSDPEVAHVAVTANSIDIDLARWAQSRLLQASLTAK